MLSLDNLTVTLKCKNVVCKGFLNSADDCKAAPQTALPRISIISKQLCFTGLFCNISH